jgi:hypothetical protein
VFVIRIVELPEMPGKNIRYDDTTEAYKTICANGCEGFRGKNSADECAIAPVEAARIGSRQVIQAVAGQMPLGQMPLCQIPLDEAETDARSVTGHHPVIK